MKKKMKLIVIIAIIMLIIGIQFQCNLVYAIDDIIDTDDYDPSGSFSLGGFKTIFKTVVAIIRNVGIVVAVIALMIIGIKYMVGSVEEKAEYKKSIPGYLLGVFLVIAMTTIPSLIYNIAVNWA